MTYHITCILDRTPMHLAAERGHTSTVEFLADKFKASVFDRTKDGSTLMHIAALNGHPDTAMILFKKGVPLLMPNKVSDTNFLFLLLGILTHEIRCKRHSQFIFKSITPHTFSEWCEGNSYSSNERTYTCHQKFVEKRRKC